MRTKTLVLAALGIVGAATVSAQVYSVNTVGYVNEEFKTGFNLAANPLDNKAANGNTVGVLFGSTLGDGAAIYKFVNGAYEPANGFTDLFGWDKADQTLMPGEGAFVYVAGAAKTVTFVGDVMQGTLTIDLKAGFNMVSSKVPQAGKLQADLGYTPADGDAIYKHTRGGGYLPTVGFTDLFGWDPGDPDIGVGEAFWISKVAAGQWTRDFTVK
jgi:hypothetical protein